MLSALREIRHAAPIFLPFRSPESSTVITSASDTPSACAASAGLSSSGSPDAPAAAPAVGTGGTTTVGAAWPLMKPSRIICCASPKPTASSAAVPAAPAPPPPLSRPLPIWYFTNSLRLPIAAMLERLSMACSTSGGTDTFSTMKLVISRPYLATIAGLISGSSASPSSV